MKIHKSVIEKILYLYQTYGGYENDQKLRAQLEKIDLTPYERKDSGETILVQTEDFLRELSRK